MPNSSQTPSTSKPYEHDFEYLNQELEWIGIRIKRILLLQQSVQKKLKKKLIDSSEKEAHLLTKEIALRSLIDNRVSQSTRLHFFEVCDTYHLNEIESQLLLLCICINLSTEHEKEFLLLDEMYGEVTIAALFIFLDLPYDKRFESRKFLTKNSALIANDLLSINFMSRFNNNKDLLRAGLEVNNQIFHYIIGSEDSFEDFEEYSSLEMPKAKMEHLVLHPTHKIKIETLIHNREEFLQRRKDWGFEDVITYGKGTFILFSGKPGTGKTMTAHAIASATNKKILNIDIPTLLQKSEAERILPSLFKMARLRNAILFFDECELFFSCRHAGKGLLSMLLTEMERFDGIAIMATNTPSYIDEAVNRRLMLKLHFTQPNAEEREAIWKQLIPPQTPLAKDVNFYELAQRFELTGGYIKNAVLMAISASIQEKSPHISQHHLLQGAEQQIENTFSDEAVIKPKVKISDIILPPKTKKQVHMLIQAVQKRRMVLEDWGLSENLSYGNGIVGLLYGPPGVGKTYTAEAIAHSLSRPLLIASPSELLSKWVGESEKEMSHLFDKAKHLNAVLFFDEADTFLTARENQPNHQISLSNLLLSKLERHEGVVILATNRANNLDRALARRIQYKIPFAYPRAEEREAIWNNFFRSKIPLAEDVDVSMLAHSFTLSGADIKNIILRCAFQAACGDTLITQRMLIRESRFEEENRVTDLVAFTNTCALA